MAHTSMLHVRVDEELKADADAHDAWFRDKVNEALADARPTVSHKQVMDEAQALIDRKRRGA